MDCLLVELGYKIRNCRQTQGITIEEVAFRAGISATHLGRIERGESNVTIGTLEKISWALNVGLTLDIYYNFK